MTTTAFAQTVQMNNQTQGFGAGEDYDAYLYTKLRLLSISR